MHYNNFDHLFLEIVNDHIHFAGEIIIIDLLSFSRQSRQVLEENIRVTRNSTKQLSHLQLGGKPVIRKAMNRINRVESAVAQQHLPRILNEMMETVKKNSKWRNMCEIIIRLLISNWGNLFIAKKGDFADAFSRNCSIAVVTGSGK